MVILSQVHGRYEGAYTYMAVSRNWGSLFQVSSYEEPYCLGSIGGPLICGKFLYCLSCLGHPCYSPTNMSADQKLFLA